MKCSCESFLSPHSRHTSTHLQVYICRDCQQVQSGLRSTLQSAAWNARPLATQTALYSGSGLRTRATQRTQQLSLLRTITGSQPTTFHTLRIPTRKGKGTIQKCKSRWQSTNSLLPTRAHIFAVLWRAKPRWSRNTSTCKFWEWVSRTRLLKLVVHHIIWQCTIHLL